MEPLCGTNNNNNNNNNNNDNNNNNNNDNNNNILIGKLHSLGVIFREVLCIKYIIVIF